MLSYITLGAADFEQAQRFYDAVLATIGWSSHMEFPGYRAYSDGGAGKGQSVWICAPFNGEPATFGNGAMVAFGAATKEQIHAFYDSAMANGGTDEGPPGPRPDYGPEWYSAYLRDPTGNKLAIVLRS